MNKNNAPMPNWIRVLIIIGVIVFVGVGIKLGVTYLSNKRHIDTPIVTTSAVNANTTTTTATTTRLTTVTTGPNVKFTANVASKGSIGTYLVDRKGMTLYWATNTAPTDWPVYFMSDIVLPGSLSLSDFSYTKRLDGTYQTTYKGWPLYYCASDKVPGDTNGQGVGGVWFAVNPSSSDPLASLSNVITTSLPVIQPPPLTIVVQHTTTTITATARISTTSAIAVTTPTTPILAKTINSHTGVYNNFFLGVVNSSTGPLGGDGCYDDRGNFIVLINNKNATDPTYTQLLNFLQSNKTDQYPYIYTNLFLPSYYGTAESHVDLTRIQGIIDGTIQPNNPDVCADFAERLHNDAEKAGIRCAYVGIDLSGYPDAAHLGIPSTVGHALDAFQTTDRGIVYVDDTGKIGSGPSRCVKTVDVQVGHDYIPVSLFPESGWNNTWDSMGTVTNMETFWDGRWSN